MQFGVLGPLAVWTHAGQPVRIPGAKVRALLAALLLEPGQLVSAGRLIDHLWGDRLPANPEGSLQSKVSQLRGGLEAAEPGGRELVRYRSPGYVLDVDGEAVDAGRFETLAARGRQTIDDDPRQARALLEEALALWRGPALAEFADDPFAQTAAARLEAARLAALEDHVEARLALGEHAALVAELDGLVDEHPLRERLRGQHMRALYRAGRQAEALDSYQQLRSRLSDELGLEPAREISALHRSILTQDTSLDAPASAPAVRASRPRTNLPASRTTLIGRDAAIDRVRDLLGANRLLTLTGPGGVGKTRLALAAASGLLDEHPDGVWLVELTSQGGDGLGDAAASVTEQVAGVLSVQDGTIHTEPATGESVERVSLVTRIARALRQRSLLLVLDNCEHVLEPVADLVDHLLSSAPDLRILATSRRPLGLGGEQLWSVPPLAVPDAGLIDEPHRLERFHGVQLFLARAGAADPGFALTSDNAEAVLDICRRLDGLPLALELAAARLRVLPARDLVARLNDRFRVLAADRRDAPSRQRTLRALIDWSWELLDPGERAVLRRLSVFAGAATLEAAEAVCASDQDADTGDVLDVLARLVDHSLVVVDEAGDGVRYRMLETIRSYGLARLQEAGEDDATRRRHAAFYADLAETGDAQLRGSAQQRWLARFDAEAADLRAAAEWAVRHHAGLALRLVGALAWYWYLRGRQQEACRLLDRALRADGDAPSAPRAAALAWLSALGSLEDSVDDPVGHGRAALALHADLADPWGWARAKLLIGGLLRPWDEVPDGDRLIDEALDAFRGLGEQWSVAAGLSVRGWLALARGDLASAGRAGEEARALFREVGCRWGEVRSTELLGQAAEIQGDYEAAAALHRAALEAAESLDLWGVVAHQLSRVGRLAALAGDYAEAVELHERALRLTRELSLEQGVVFARVGLGLIARRQGRLDDAEQHFRAVLDWHQERGFHSGAAFCLAELGFVSELRGDSAQARALHLAGLDMARRSGDQRAVALTLEGMAGAAAGHTGEIAARLLGAAAAVRAATGGPLPPAERADVDRVASAAEAVLGQHAYAAAFDEGQGLGLEAAVSLARAAAEAGEAR